MSHEIFDESSPGVSAQRDGTVLVIVVDNPPINAASLVVRSGLIAAIARLKEDGDLRAAVIVGAGRTFIAGSDLHEFGQPISAPSLPDVISAIEDCGKPVVAALHGAALGGGFELALGCDARIASDDAVVGLPEVTLGMIPGAGGTQRLPRIVGVVRAIEMICSGERLRSDTALALGLVDRISDGNLRDAAVAYARDMMGRKRRLRDTAVPPGEDAAIVAATASFARAGQQRRPVLAAIEAVKSAATLPIDQALARERAVFQELRMSPEAFALRHQFFAERDSAKRPELAGTRARELNTLAIIGGGTMGCGIAISALDAGLHVILVEQDDAALQRARARVGEHYRSRVAAGKVEASTAAGCETRLRATTEWEAIARADLVIEAVFEDLGTKRSVFQQIDAFARSGAVLASNTSYLDLDAIASATQRPQDVLGLHFFSPANVMKLLEVVRGAETLPEVLATGIALAKRLQKLPVLSANAFGFIGNRIYSAYRRQCEFMLEEGAYPEQVDSALQEFGFAMGPFAVADMSGLDIAWRMRQAQAATRDPAARYVHIADRLCEMGRLGRKSGSGYYRYDSGKRSDSADPEVRAVIHAASAAKGLNRRVLPVAEIQRRALLAMVNEAALLLTEGVATRASDVDVVLVNGYGFPRWQGGPIFWARRQSADQLASAMNWLADLSGPGFLRGDVEGALNISPTAAPA